MSAKQVGKAKNEKRNNGTCCTCNYTHTRIVCIAN